MGQGDRWHEVLTALTTDKRHQCGTDAWYTLFCGVVSGQWKLYWSVVSMSSTSKLSNQQNFETPKQMSIMSF